MPKMNGAPGPMQLMDDQAEQRLGGALRHVPGDGDRRRATGERRRGVHAGDAAVGAEQQLVQGLDRMARSARRLAVEREVRLGGELVVPAADRRGDVGHHGEVAGVLGDDDQRLGGVRHHRAEALEQRDVRVALARVRVGHDEVDVGERVAEAYDNLLVYAKRYPDGTCAIVLSPQR